MANAGPVINEPLLDKGIQNWMASHTGGHPKLDDGQRFLEPRIRNPKETQDQNISKCGEE